VKLLIGEQWGNYRLLRLLGQGGSADVYLGEHIHLKMHTAIKILHASLPMETTNDFYQEARIISDLEHPHIVRLLDLGVRDGRPFLVLEYAPNGSLQQKYPRGTRLPLPLVVEYISQVASALQYAHDRRLVHRDVKPGNMLINRQGNILLSDFGIVTTAHSTQSMNLQEVLGTPSYIAPEQIQGYPRAASDQYALAVVAYQWLGGGSLFQGSSSEIIAQHLGATPRPLRELASDLPLETAQVIHTALAREPRMRFESVSAFAAALASSAGPIEERATVTMPALSAPLTSSLHQQPNPPRMSVPLTTSSVFPIQPAEFPETPDSLQKSTSRPLVASAALPAPVAEKNGTLTMPTIASPVRQVVRNAAQTAPSGRSAPLQTDLLVQDAQSVLADEGALTPIIPISDTLSFTPPKAQAATTPVRQPSRAWRILLLLAALCLLLTGGVAFWHPWNSASSAPQAMQQQPPASSNTSKNGNIKNSSHNSPSGGQTPGTASGRSTPPAPTAQPTATPSAQVTSTPSGQPTSGTPAPVTGTDCLSASTQSITITQLVGATVSLPGTAVTLTNCGTATASWSATSHINGSGPDWTTCSTTSGMLSPNGSQTVYIAAGSPDELLGTYTAQWVFNMGNASWTVQVTLIVVA
jgi:serine/threonine protein kinase